MDGYRPRMGLALGCGSARGWAHIGPIEALLATRFDTP
jgi:predicted acylesterase/phospholipase RssA